MLTIDNIKFTSFDYVTIVNKEFVITYNSRVDSSLSSNSPLESKGFALAKCVGQDFFEAYPTVKKEESSVLKAMTTGEIVLKEKQDFEDLDGNIYCTNNVTIPLIHNGTITGVMELVKDVTDIEFVDRSRFLKKEEKISKEVIEKLVDSAFNEKNITFEDIITSSENMKRCIKAAKTMAKTRNANLIYGETGTGKEIFAQAMINASGVSKKKVVIQNCAAIPENLMESLLFGTQKGAYTGAENKKGLFEDADKGVLFLDEINSLPLQLQGKLLRVLQDGTFRPIGANKEKKVHLKVIAAMNIDPIIAVEEGTLRKDLFYRLSNGTIYLPPLRERKEDILIFVNHYIASFNYIYQKQVKGITDPLKELFLNYEWEGNVRELKHCIDNMINMAEGDTLDIGQLPAYMYDKVYAKVDLIEEKVKENTSNSCIKGDEIENLELLSLKKTLEKTEIDLINTAMRMAKGNKTKAGELLGIPRQTLKYKITKWKLNENDWG